MKKITARDLHDKLDSGNSKTRPGESLKVTQHSRAPGRYTKGAHGPVKMPDFAKYAREQPISPATGSKLIREYFKG